MEILYHGTALSFDRIEKLYEQPWRHHHTMKHVAEVLKYLEDRMDKMHFAYDYSIDDIRVICNLFALFHDAVYEIGSHNNELQSIEVLRGYCLYGYCSKIIVSDKEKWKNIVDDVSHLIELTSHPQDAHQDAHQETERIFMDADWHGMRTMLHSDIVGGEYKWLQEYERNVFLEYQKYPIDVYIAGRKDFLNQAVDNKLITDDVRDYLVSIVDRKYNVGVYCGSFNPFHIGHGDVLKKAEKIFDKVVVSRGINPNKSNSFINELNDILPYHETNFYLGQLVEHIESYRSEHCNPVLVRGLRNGYDLEQESNLIRFINEQADARGWERIPVVYIPCDKEYEHISSSAIRMLPENDMMRYSYMENRSTIK